jgi:hypothetical protein
MDVCAVQAATMANASQSWSQADFGGNMAELGLAEAIGQLRNEIGAAVKNAKGSALQFDLGPIELELQVELVVSGGAKADFKWVVVSLGGEARAQNTQRHRVKLVLTPKLNDEPVKVSDKRDKRPD